MCTMAYSADLTKNKSIITITLTFIILLFACPFSAMAEQDTITNDIGMTFIRVEPGNFTMGSSITERFRNKDEVQHEVTITSAYYLQDSEVTLEQWWAVMGKRWLCRRKGEGNLPVTRVSWHDCIKFINKLNKKGKGTYRLPTEAEWEYACRAGSFTAYFWGNDIDCSKAMFANNQKKDSECTLYYETLRIKPDGPAPVKSFAPNAWGFYDMHGNVWEWCQDMYGEYLAGPVESSYSTTSSDSRVRRGGSWYKHAHSLRSANRTYAHPAAKFQTTGFRLVLEAD
ncbi:MAG: formylglycine-generating enzyme family protein [Desulfobacterales bacterium]|nr:formylglycine-generating enzyme family protein [Desulfobacterales bacterium]